MPAFPFLDARFCKPRLNETGAGREGSSTSFSRGLKNHASVK